MKTRIVKIKRLYRSGNTTTEYQAQYCGGTFYGAYMPIDRAGLHDDIEKAKKDIDIFLEKSIMNTTTEFIEYPIPNTEEDK